MNDYYKAVTSYFNEKAEQYDFVDNQIYWVFSDTFFKEVLRLEIPQLIKSSTIKLLDAGAGTGRWALFFDELFGKDHSIQGTLVDISDGMLKVAEKKLASQNKADRFSCMVGDIEDLSAVEDTSFDVSLSFYNVLSFVEHPQKALEQIHKKLKPEGVHVSVVANTYHAYYFAILTNQLHILDLIRDESKVQFNSIMPPMHCFTPEKIKSIYKAAGFSSVEVVGGPNFIYPGMDETYVNGRSESSVNKLSNPENFNKMLSIELENYRNPDIVGRANCLMVIAKK
jgi:ubiquinone/menaquinone biosynthesis C-methylase UbiE